MSSASASVSGEPQATAAAVNQLKELAANSIAVAPGADGLAVLPPFDVSGRTVLVTGGASGIGLVLVEQFIKHKAKTILITGRREDAMKEAQKRFPESDIRYFVSDAGKESDRVELFSKVSTLFPNLSVVVHNAGIQRRVPLAIDTADWKQAQEEIEINLSAPIHLSKLFAPLLLKQKTGAAILYVTGGVAFLPFTAAPVYAATKAALHSFILSQRISFEGSSVRIIEIVPPAVKTNLGGSHSFGEDAQQFAESVFQRWIQGEQEVGFKVSEVFRMKGRVELIEQANALSKNLNLPRYKNDF